MFLYSVKSRIEKEPEPMEYVYYGSATAILVVLLFSFFSLYGIETRKKRYIKYVYSEFMREDGEIPGFEYENQAASWCWQIVNRYKRRYPVIKGSPGGDYMGSMRAAQKLLRLFISEKHISHNLIKDGEIFNQQEDKGRKLRIMR